MKYEKIYQKLRKKYTDEQIVDSMLIPADMTSDIIGEETIGKRNKRVQNESVKNMTEEDIILSDVMRLRFQMEEYIKGVDFSFEKHLENT